MASFAWPSVIMLRGSRVVVDRTIVKCSWNENFASVLEKLGGEYSSERVSRVVISSNERLVEPAHIAPLDAPIKLLETYNCHYVCYYLEEESVEALAAADEVRSVATVLMQSARQVIQPPIATPSSDSQLRGDYTLRNDFIKIMLDRALVLFQLLVNTLSTLWHLDPHHKQFEER